VDEESTADKAFVEAAGWGGPNMWFNRVPEAKAAKNRMHFDLRAPGPVADEVTRLAGIGATVLEPAAAPGTVTRAFADCGSCGILTRDPEVPPPAARKFRLLVVCET
jgi:hypothetical protein